MKKSLFAGIAAAALLLAGCSTGSRQQLPAVSLGETNVVPVVPGYYDSLDTAVLVKIDSVEHVLTFLNLSVNRYYSLNYDGATSFNDRYAQPLALSQVPEGCMADISFVKDTKRLNSLQLSPGAFYVTGISDVLFSEDGSSLFFRNQNYSLSPVNVILTPDGVGEFMDISPADTFSIAGEENTVYCLKVEKGHGYIRLENAEYFRGGWLQVGEKQVSQIGAEPLIAVPEGEWDVTVSNKGSTGTEHVVVTRGAEVSVDAGKWVSEPMYGGVRFHSIPEDARIYIDGEVIDSSREQKLSYGIHQMVVTADGYTTLSRYIRVAQASADLSIVLEKDPSVSAGSISESTVSQSVVTYELTPTPVHNETRESGDNELVTATPTPTPTPSAGTSDNIAIGPVATPIVSRNEVINVGEYRVYINSPEGVEVYKDGIYLGISPLSFKKEGEGNTVITLRKNGCQTRSYTIYMDSQNKDLSYSFSELVPIQ
ncbi:MAG: hypothetical protein IKI75_10575 [Lachnospiraceae bacterium]|nr:hypothetical protein [Lachnospiraceae bacterium]